jgi:uncharacterized protein (DUF2147 family)
MSFLLGMALAGAAAIGPGDNATGRWMTETKHGIVEVTMCGTSICGHLVESDAIRADPDARDTKNKEEGQRSRRLKGLLILQGFTAKDGGWAGGTIYNGDDGGTYNATVTQIDRDHLKVRGCIVWPLCKSQTWTRLH